MAIQVKQFSVGKDADLNRINRFFKEAGLKTSNILSVRLVEQGRDIAKLVVVYEDTTHPFLEATLPNDGDNHVGVGTPIIAIFSEAIQNVTTSDIEIYDISNEASISPSLFSIDNTGASNDRGEIRIVDLGYMVANTKYRITFKQSIVDLAGNALEEEESILFGTSVVESDLSFDGGRVLSLTESPLISGRYETIITPDSISYDPDTTLLDLTLRCDTEDTDLPEFRLYYEDIVTPTGSFQVVLSSTGILPTGQLSIDWKATIGFI